MSQEIPPPSDGDEQTAAIELPQIEFESPGRFPIDNPPTRSAPEPQWQAAPFQLGVDGPIQRFELPEQARGHALSLISQARRSLCIYTNDLEPWLYHQTTIQQACTEFLLASPHNRLRILLADPARVIKEGHRLLNLARRLSSNCLIRKMHPDYPIEAVTFLLADRHGLLLRPRVDQPDGFALYNDAGRVKLRQAQFDQAWDVSQTDPDLRSFLL